MYSIVVKRGIVSLHVKVLQFIRKHKLYYYFDIYLWGMCERFKAVTASHSVLNINHQT